MTQSFEYPAFDALPSASQCAGWDVVQTSADINGGQVPEVNTVEDYLNVQSDLIDRLNAAETKMEQDDINERLEALSIAHPGLYEAATAKRRAATRERIRALHSL